MVDYPLRFTPVLHHALWGGRRLETHLAKQLPDEREDYAESWELADHGTEQTRVAAGPLTGRTLGELVRQHGPDLLGIHAPQVGFPLLLKFLDACRDLSVQVHPNDEQASRLSPPDRGKTEAWVVLDAEPDGVIYAGLRAGVTRQQLVDRIRDGSCADCLHCVTPQAGDALYIPAGTVHALGGGVLVAEIQQASDTTFRLFDWNRVGPAGRPRQLHLEQGLEVVDFDRGPVPLVRPQPTERGHVKRLAVCDHFVLERWQWQGVEPTAADGRFRILVVLAGQVRVERDLVDRPLGRGAAVLVPAAAGSLRVEALQPATMLEIYLPFPG